MKSRKHTQIIFVLTLLMFVPVFLQAQQQRDRFKQRDKNSDGKLTKDETTGRLAEQFGKTDVNKDGALTREEFEAYQKNRTRPRQNRGDSSKLYKEDPRVSAKYHDQLPEDLKDKVTVKAKVYYGDKEFQFVNAFLLKSDQPAPVILTHHAGGWAKGVPTTSAAFRNGSEQIKYLRAGISWVDVGYSLTGADYSKATRTKDPASWPVQGQDATRAVQLTRHMAKEWNIDPDRIATTGVSAGGHLAMWVAFSDDQTEPESKDPLKRLSSRVACVICPGAPVDFRWFDYPTLVASEDPTKAGSETGEGLSQKDLATCLLGLLGCSAEEFDKTEVSKRIIDDANIINKIDKDDPPALLVFRPMNPNVSTYPKYLSDPHSYWNGVALQRKFAEVGVDYDYEGGADWETKFEFLKKHLRLKGTVRGAVEGGKTRRRKGQ